MAEKTKVKILGISGSPRRNGNTTLAVKYALKDAAALAFVEATDFIALADLNLKPCTGCMKCFGWRAPAEDEDFECYESHDDSATVMKKMKWCDGLIFGVPVYNQGVPALAKIIMDKAHCFGPWSFTRNAGAMMYKALAPLVVGATDFSGQGNVLTQVKLWGLNMGMIPNMERPREPYRLPFRGEQLTTAYGRTVYDADAITKESSRVIPPLLGAKNMRGAGSAGINVAIRALWIKAGLRAIKELGIKIPPQRLFKKYNIMPEKGSYVEKLVLEGKLELVDPAVPKF
jgi:multimeric flavodoxin WrbA